ncbi:MAG: hypothetical protein PHD83_06265, partial [Caldisericia bacterium]|nr:hypothetical protein [Caldisericia bacterium]
MKKSRAVWILLLIFVLSHALSVGILPQKVKSTQKSPNRQPSIGLSNRFIRAIRPQQEDWILLLPSVTVFFKPTTVVFLCNVSAEERMQVTLTFESPDPSGMQVKLISDRLCYQNVQDGVDIEFYMNGRENLEYDLFVKKQVVLENLHFRLSGCEVFRSDHNLCWKISNFTALERVLSVFQQEDGMPVSYRLTLDSANEYHYSINYPDSVKFPIIVDPEIEFSTYFGEEDQVSLESVVQDASGAIYTCGSIQLPSISPEDGYQTRSEKTNTDTILLKMDPKGEMIFQSVIVGGEDG